MNRSELAAERLRELFLDGKWIANTNVKELLSGICFEQATKKVSDLNTIAELTFHINYYLAGVLKAIESSELDIHDKLSFQLPPIQAEHEWQNLVNELLSNAERFATLVGQLPDQRLDQAFVNEKYGSNLRNIEAIIEHSYYHFGQIALIKKLTQPVAE